MSLHLKNDGQKQKKENSLVNSHPAVLWESGGGGWGGLSPEGVRETSLASSSAHGSHGLASLRLRLAGQVPARSPPWGGGKDTHLSALDPATRARLGCDAPPPPSLLTP